MRTVSQILYSFLAIFLIIVGFLIGERVFRFQLPASKVIVDRAFIDSIKSLKPDTIVKDSLIFKDTIIYRNRPIPTPIPISPTVNYYVDSLINDSTYIVIKDTIEGILKHREVDVQRAIVLREIRVPYPHIVERLIEVHPPARHEAYMDLKVGSLVGGEVGIVFPNNMKAGFLTLTDFNDRFYLVSLGYRFKRKN